MSSSVQSPSGGDALHTADNSDQPFMKNGQVVVSLLRPKPSMPYPPLEVIPSNFEPMFPDPVGDNGYKFKTRSWFELAQFDELSDNGKQDLAAERKAIRNAEKKMRLQEAKAAEKAKEAEAAAAAAATQVNPKRAKRRLREKAKKAQAAADALAAQAEKNEAKDECVSPSTQTSSSQSASSRSTPPSSPELVKNKAVLSGHRHD